VIVESIMSAAAQDVPEDDVVKKIYELRGLCGGTIQDSVQILEEIGFAISSQYWSASKKAVTSFYDRFGEVSWDAITSLR
jgi:hypothetical protein